MRVHFFTFLNKCTFFQTFQNPCILSYLLIWFSGHWHLDGHMHCICLRGPLWIHTDKLPLAKGSQRHLHQFQRFDPDPEELDNSPPRQVWISRQNVMAYLSAQYLYSTFTKGYVLRLQLIVLPSTYLRMIIVTRHLSLKLLCVLTTHSAIDWESSPLQMYCKVLCTRTDHNILSGI